MARWLNKAYREEKTVKRMDGFVALRRIYVDGYVYHDACTTVKPLSHWAAAVGEKLRTAFAREFPKCL